MPAGAGGFLDSELVPYMNDPNLRGMGYRLYKLDGASNWLSREDASGLATSTFEPLPQPPNRYAQWFHPGSSSQVWAYDSAGNVRVFGDRQFHYNVMGQPTTSTGSGFSYTFGFDALGRKAIERNETTGQVTNFTWDGDALAAWGTTLDNFSIRVGGLDKDQHVAVVENFGSGVVRYLHQADDGSVLALTNDSGLLEGYGYTAFGERTIYDSTGAIAIGADGQPARMSGLGNRLAYQGQIASLIPDTYEFPNRFYSADFGRFLTPDPLAMIGGENPYAFVAGKPLSLSDPTGLTPVQPSIGNPELSNFELLILADPNVLRMLSLLKPQFRIPSGTDVSNYFKGAVTGALEALTHLPNSVPGFHTEMFERGRSTYRTFFSLATSLLSGPPATPSYEIATSSVKATSSVALMTSTARLAPEAMWAMQDLTLRAQQARSREPAEVSASRPRIADTAEWRALRDEILAKNPICEYCQSAPATQADHLIAYKIVRDLVRSNVLTRQEAMEILTNPDNFVASCLWCNASKGARQAGLVPRPHVFAGSNMVDRVIDLVLAIFPE
jgi:RHS repeat-associated protein